MSRVSLSIRYIAEGVQALQDHLADGGGIFSDAAGEDQGIHATQNGSVGPDILFQPVGEYFQGKFGPALTCLGGLDYIAHVVTEAGDAEQS